MSRRCKSCNGSEIEYDEASGDSVCVSCGIVLEENAIVSAIEFADAGTGSSSIVGKFVSATSTRPYSGAPKGYGLNRESREIAIENGRKLIQDLAARLRLSQHVMDSAHRLFILAIQRNFVQGRTTVNVVAACLYIVCRREKSEHLLIDFADALETNVFTLGACFLKFTRLLHLQLPVIDPSLYIHRFAGKLDLGDKLQPVCLTALRLVQRMKRDWIETGRRPAGVCGAALVMAVRIHGFPLSRDDILKVVRVDDNTVRSRLMEFEAVPSSQLTPEDFEQLTLPQTSDPPSFVKNKEEEALLAKVAAKLNGVRRLVSDSEVVRALEDMATPREMKAAGPDMTGIGAGAGAGAGAGVGAVERDGFSRGNQAVSIGGDLNMGVVAAGADDRVFGSDSLAVVRVTPDSTGTIPPVAAGHSHWGAADDSSKQVAGRAGAPSQTTGFHLRASRKRAREDGTSGNAGGNGPSGYDSCDDESGKQRRILHRSTDQGEGDTGEPTDDREDENEEDGNEEDEEQEQDDGDYDDEAAQPLSRKEKLEHMYEELKGEFADGISAIRAKREHTLVEYTRDPLEAPTGDPHLPRGVHDSAGAAGSAGDEDDQYVEDQDATGDDAEALSSDSDDEDEYILSAEEASNRKLIWESLNKEFLEEQREKIERGDLPAPHPRKRRNTHKDKSQHQKAAQVPTTSEALLAAQLHRRSKKLNYNAMPLSHAPTVGGEAGDGPDGHGGE